MKWKFKKSLTRSRYIRNPTPTHTRSPEHELNFITQILFNFYIKLSIIIIFIIFLIHIITFLEISLNFLFLDLLNAVINNILNIFKLKC